ncbi:MAG: Ig-like domain-containing protein [Fibrobacterota bacterium]|nr:Ig-like domain-containing protein [Fibrobacterota bacterium]
MLAALPFFPQGSQANAATGSQRTITAQPGPGIPSLTYTTAELFKPLATFHSPAGTSWGNGTLFRGYLVLGIDVKEDSAGLQFWDISDPRQPKLVHQKYDSESKRLREIQGFSFTSSYGPDYVAIPSHAGIEIWDFTDIRNPKSVSALAMSKGGGAGIYNGIISAFWQPPYIYCGGMNTGLYVVDARDPKAPKLVKQVSNSTVNGKLVGGVFAVGNILYVTTMQDAASGGAISTFDLADPANPILMDSYVGVLSSDGGYTSYLNGNRIYGQGTTGYLQVFDVSDPFEIKRVGQSPQKTERGGYGMIQDGFAHAGMSDTYVKYDVTGSLPVEVGRCAVPGDNDWTLTLGNLVFIGDDDGPASTGILAPHQTAPDKQGPVVNMAYPRPGAVDQPLSTRVGFTFTDNVDFGSVLPTTFIVRPVGGSPLSGKYATMAGASVVNFTPDVPLLANTTYEVRLPAGGLKDLAGNGIPRDTLIRFTTGSTSALSPVGLRKAKLGVEAEIRNILGRWIGPARRLHAHGPAPRPVSESPKRETPESP